MMQCKNIAKDTVRSNKNGTHTGNIEPGDRHAALEVGFAYMLRPSTRRQVWKHDRHASLAFAPVNSPGQRCEDGRDV